MITRLYVESSHQILNHQQSPDKKIHLIAHPCFTKNAATDDHGILIVHNADLLNTTLK